MWASMANKATVNSLQICEHSEVCLLRVRVLTYPCLCCAWRELRVRDDARNDVSTPHAAARDRLSVHSWTPSCESPSARPSRCATRKYLGHTHKYVHTNTSTHSDPIPAHPPTSHMSASASISTSHAYTSLLSTLHERSSLLSSAGSTIPPSLNRTLKRQLDAFARSIEEGSSGSAKSQQQQQQQRRDVRLKWDRIREALEDDEDGRRALLSVRDG